MAIGHNNFQVRWYNDNNSTGEYEISECMTSAEADNFITNLKCRIPNVRYWRVWKSNNLIADAD